MSKLVSLLSTGSLWFARQDTLGDPHEGSMTVYNLRMRPEWYPGASPATSDQLVTLRRARVRAAFVSCWHMNETESMAMWDIYAGRGESVAISSTFRQLRDSLVDVNRIYIGQVQYIDPNTEAVPESNLLYQTTHKRKAYEYERELRAVIDRFDAQDWAKEQPLGLPVECRLEELVESIYVSPTAPPWFLESVEARGCCVRLQLARSRVLPLGAPCLLTGPNVSQGSRDSLDRL